MSSYFEVINFLLTTYATGGVVAKAVKELNGYHKRPGILASDYAEILYLYASGCGIVYERKIIKSLIVKSLDESVGDNVRLP